MDHIASVDMQVSFLHISYYWLSLDQKAHLNNMITIVINPKLEG